MKRMSDAPHAGLGPSLFVNFGGAGATIFNLYLGGRILLFIHETTLLS